MKLRLVFIGILCLLLVLPAAGFAADDEPTEPPQQGEVPDGDFPQGDRPQGERPDGERPHGNGTHVGNFVPVVPYIFSLPEEEVSETEESTLHALMEVERLGAEVNRELAETWEQPKYHIAGFNHRRGAFDIRAILHKYEIMPEAERPERGIFDDGELQSLYDELTVEGTISEEEALTVSMVTVDYVLYRMDTAYTVVDNEDIRALLQNIGAFSRNQIRAIAGVMADAGLTYATRYMSQSMYDDIVATERETDLLDADGNVVEDFEFEPPEGGGPMGGERPVCEEGEDCERPDGLEPGEGPFGGGGPMGGERPVCEKGEDCERPGDGPFGGERPVCEDGEDCERPGGGPFGGGPGACEGEDCPEAPQPPENEV